METAEEMRIRISTGGSRAASVWKETETAWEEFCGRCAAPRRTRETAAEYAAMGRDDRAKAKDAGGFVGGRLKDGRRTRGSCEGRTLLTLDIDHPDGTAESVWERASSLWPDTAMLVYSTHSHTPAAPRLRLVAPLARETARELYEPAARAFAARIRIDIFDSTTFDPERLFFWPSCPSDGEFFFRRQDGEPLDAAALLSAYKDPMDEEEWPRCAWEADRPARAAVRSEARAAGCSPCDKPGAVGAFCRAYPVHEAVAAFLSDTYIPVKGYKDRYTYKGASSSGGMVVYGDHACSFHESDPARGRALNAFDLVRTHRFGFADTRDYGGDIAAAPSFRLMRDFAASLPAVRRELDRQAARDFAEMAETAEKGEEGGPGGETGAGGTDAPATGEAPSEAAKTAKNGVPAQNALTWTALLTRSRRRTSEGTEEVTLPTRPNARLILENDPAVAGKVARNLFTGWDDVTGKLPWKRSGQGAWNDCDDACLRVWMEDRWRLSGRDCVTDALATVTAARSFHPVRDYLNSLAWDGVERLDRLVIDYIGAEDNALNRAMTRKHFAAAAARVFEPGVKYDYALILTGPEGAGKSSLLRIMGGPWFSDSVTTADGKEGMDQLRGAWIIELSELAALRMAGVEQMKSYLSRQTDTYRPAYGRRQVSFPRQCVFCGTTNEDNFLKGDSGNRRFWVIRVDPGLRREEGWMEAIRRDRDQLWAEAVERYRAGEPLFLAADEEAEARQRQREHNDNYDDPVWGIIDGFLDMPLPYGWETWDTAKRYRYVHTPKDGSDYYQREGRDDEQQRRQGRRPRTVVCAMEILQEAIGDRPGRNAAYDARRINKYLDSLPGWRKGGRNEVSSHCRNLYGIQRAYYRKEADSEDNGGSILEAGRCYQNRVTNGEKFLVTGCCYQNRVTNGFNSDLVTDFGNSENLFEDDDL